MSTDVISSMAGSLDADLEKARESLRGVDSNLQKLFGKDAAELSFNNRNRDRAPRPQVGRRREDHHEDEPGEKRRRMDGGRLGPVVIPPRIRPRYDESEDLNQGLQGRRLQSRIVSSVKEKSRDEVLAEQSKDRVGRDRNRRMFGALMGTLQRFKQDETKLQPKEEKRAQIEAKLDEAAKKERDEVRKERSQLMKERKLQLTEIKRLEVKRRRIAELEQWESKTKFLSNFIRTEAVPNIFYLPKVHNPITECKLDESKQFVTEMIANKRKTVLEDLEDYEARSRRYFEDKAKNESGGVGARIRRMDLDPRDEDLEFELREIMKQVDAENENEDEPEDFTITVTTKTELQDVPADIDTKEENEDAETEEMETEAENGENADNGTNNGVQEDMQNSDESDVENRGSNEIDEDDEA